MSTIGHLRAAFHAGARIQAWHLRTGATTSKDGQWETVTPKTGAEPRFECPEHLYRVHPEDEHIVAEPSVLPFDDDVQDILGRPCFTLIGFANALRKGGAEIKPRAEDEQAAVLHWMLSLYLQHGKGWRAAGSAALASLERAPVEGTSNG